MNLLITGIDGWVAQALATRCSAAGHRVRGSSRHVGVPFPAARIDISIDADWAPALEACDVVLHLAARVHVLNDHAANPLALFRAVNTAGTLHLARQAAAAGVRRFVFVSSVKVNGEHTLPGQPFRHNDAPLPRDPYGISKHEAETGLRQLARGTGMEVVIVRPPLVYGPGVKANFAALMLAIQRGMPLPLASVTENHRSFVALDNLVDLLVTCIDHPAAGQQTFLAGDGEDLSTADLLRRLGHAMRKPVRLFPVSTAMLEAGARLIGKGDVAQRLLGNLQVDITHTRQALGWHPPISVDEGLRRAAARFRP